MIGQLRSGMFGYVSGTCVRVLEDHPHKCKHPMDLGRPTAQRSEASKPRRLAPINPYRALSSKRNLPKPHVSSASDTKPWHHDSHQHIYGSPSQNHWPHSPKTHTPRSTPRASPSAPSASSTANAASPPPAAPPDSGPCPCIPAR